MTRATNLLIVSGRIRWMMTDKKYLTIISHYEPCLRRHGGTHLGVDWPKEEDADTRYQVNARSYQARGQRRSPKGYPLGFRLWASHLYEYMLKKQVNGVDYSGLDLSDEFIRLSKAKFPNLTYYHADILEDTSALPFFDYIVLNGVFTLKCDLSFPEMLEFFQKTVRRTFQRARVGTAFNVMSKQVDWERHDLCHLPLDTLASFLTHDVSRNFVVRPRLPAI